MEVKKLRFISSMEIKSVLILFSLVVFYGMTITNHTISAFSKKKNVVKVINSSKESLFVNPNFTSSSPTNGANNVNQDANIVLNFDIAIDASTVNATNIVVSGSNTGFINGVFSGGGTNTITFNPTSDFKPGELVSVIITTGLQEDGGVDALSNSISFSFKAKISSTTDNLVSTQTELLISNSQDKPKGIISVDMDKDGDMDVLVSSADDGKVVWYENDGGQSFSIHQVESGLMRARFSIAVDLDSDGDLDIVSIGETANRLQWYANDGNQNFSSAIIIALDNRPFSLSAADLDRDGDIDLIVPNINDDQLIWYENDGNQNFSSNIIIDNDNNPGTEQAIFNASPVDIDHDGDEDILIAEFNKDTFFLLENDGSQNFTPQTIGFSDGAATISPIDMDNDGDLDVVAGSWNSNEVIWFENTGVFPFTKHVISTNVHDLINQVKATDLDGDGDYDIVASGKDNGTIGFYENDGSQNFTLQKTITNVSGTEFVEVADLDSDGDIDVLASVGDLDKIVWYEDSTLLLVSTSPAKASNNIDRNANIILNFDTAVDAASVNANTINISGDLTGNIPGTFSGGGTSQITFNPTTDFKAGETITVTITDGLLDDSFKRSISKTISYNFITKTDLNLGFNVDLNQTGINIDASQTSPFSVDSADIDGDGDIDIVVGTVNSNLNWYENDGNQNFTKHLISNVLFSPGIITVADLDGDGNLDVVVASADDDIILWFKNDGNENFGFPIAIGTAMNPRTLNVIDMDNDGDMDVVSASSDDTTLAWYENNGSEIFTKRVINSDMFIPKKTSTVDLDGDNDIDILVADGLTNFTNEFSWFENTGNQVFVKHILPPFTPSGSVINIGGIDFDFDGDLDIYISSESKVSWLENDGEENFTENNIIENLSSTILSTRLADIDGDTDFDVVLRLRGAIKVYINDGNHNFDSTYEIAFSESPDNNFVDLNLSDIDGDQDIDILTISFTGNTLTWYENKTVSSWKGATSDWHTTSNWSTNTVPSGTDNVVVLDNGIIPIASSDISLDKLVLEKNSELTVNGNLTGTTINLETSSSLIVGGTVSGNLTYTRAINNQVWYGIASPVIGQNVDNFVNNQNLLLGTGNNLGLGVYDNSLPGWSYYDSSNGESGFNFMPGEGRIINLIDGHVRFSGTMNTNDVLDINLTRGVNGFNLLGNPYPSYINGNAILTTNSALLSEQSFWLWNQETNSYDTYNLTSNLKIAPTQAFFVNANANASNFSITEAMQSHNETDTFQRQANNSTPTITLQLSNGPAQNETVIKYIEGTTTGFDNGYDSSIFEAGNSRLVLYSNLVTDNEGQKLSIQSLPNENYEDMVIPIGFQVKSAGEFTISAESFDLPDNLKLYLEDREQNSVTELSDASDYSINVEADSEITNRFFLHTKSRTLSLNDIDELKNVNVYVVNDYLYIKGLNNEKGTLQLYNLLGQKFIDENIENIDSNYKIKLPRVSKGVFVVNLEYNGKKITKKILL